MTQDEYDSVAGGDIVQSIRGDAFQVIAVFITKADDGKKQRTYIVQRTLTMTNPDEWKLLHRGSYPTL